MIESSVTDTNWLRNIPRYRQTIIVAEGILEYLKLEDVETLLNRVTQHFNHGQIIFDVMSSFAINSEKEKLKETTGAIHKWAVDDVKEVDKLNPGLKRITELSVFSSLYMKNLPLGYLLFFKVMVLFPKFRNMIRLIRYQF